MTIPFWTAGGNTINLLDLQPADLSAEVLADALAKINRFSGRTPEPWSVAMHSVLVESLCPPDLRPWALLHDAHEAIIGDITSPAVDFIARVGRNPDIHECIGLAKGRLDRAIGAAWSVAVQSVAYALRRADRIALQAEAIRFLDAEPVLFDPNDEDDLDRAHSILEDMPAPRDWRGARDLWLSRVDHYAQLGLMNPPRTHDPACAVQA